MSGPMDVNPYQAPASPTISPYPSNSFGQGDSMVTPKVVEMLRQTQPWVRFLSVLAFIAFGLLLLAGGGLLFGMTAGRAELAIMFVVYGVMGGLYLGPAIFLGRYASNIAKLRMTLRADDLESAMEAQKSFWRFAGIVALIVLLLYVLVLVFGFASLAFFSTQRSPFGR
jgi:hypothetical protein